MTISSRPGLIQFLVRLCAGVGGLVATSAMVSAMLKNCVDFYCCRRGGGKEDTAPLLQNPKYALIAVLMNQKLFF